MLNGANSESTADAFLKSIVRSGLLDSEQLEGALRYAAKDRLQDPQAIADYLVEKGTLSSFQAQRLLKGSSTGLVLGPYHIISPIGKGGMGSVYLARDTRNGRPVAIKVLPPKRAREEERMVARFRREMEISKKVAHPHVALTYEVGVYQDVYFIAMEYIPGKNLYRLVSDEGPLKVNRAAKLFAEVASGLAHAHQQGLIHRDLKPSNIMITPNGHAKVLDLGLALIEGEATEAKEIIGGQGYVVGSMDYIAPEQTKDAVAVDARADIYGLGCTLFFALTGNPPFPGGTPKDKIRRHRLDTPPNIRDLNPAVPFLFADVVHKMMSKDPDLRYSTASELQEVLLEWADGEPSLPLDHQEDIAYQQAVQELERAKAPMEVVNTTLLEKVGQRLSSAHGWNRYIAEAVPTSQEGDQIYLWLCAAMIGFWVVLLLILGIVLLIR